jgi:hypothetical protein
MSPEPEKYIDDDIADLEERLDCVAEAIDILQHQQQCLQVQMMGLQKKAKPIKPWIRRLIIIWQRFCRLVSK